MTSDDYLVKTSKVQTVCIWSSWRHWHPKTPSSLASFKSKLVLPFCYQLTQVVLEKRPLNGCSNSSYLHWKSYFYIIFFLWTCTLLQMLMAKMTQVLSIFFKLSTSDSITFVRESKVTRRHRQRNCSEMSHVSTSCSCYSIPVHVRQWQIAAMPNWPTGTSAGFWLGGSMPPCRLRRRKLWKFDYEMVHSGVYLNTPACPDCSQNIT